MRECLAADIPLAVDHFRYFAGVRAQEGRLSQIDEDTVAYHFYEPLAWWVRSSMELPNPHGNLEDCASTGNG